MNATIAAGLVMVVLGAAPVGVALIPRDDSPVAVIAPPWAPHGAALKAALEVPGALISIAPGGRTVIFAPDTHDAVAKLYQAGAALVVRAGVVSACTSSSSSLSSPTALNGPAGKRTPS